MIPITPIPGGALVLLEADRIEAVEAADDTVVVLTDRRRVVVTESPEAIVASIHRARAGRLARASAHRVCTEAEVLEFRPRAVAG